MKKSLAVILCGFAVSANASFIDLSSSTLNLTGTTVSSGAGYSSALSVNAQTAGNVLVIGTFSSSSAEKQAVGAGSWRLNYDSGAQTSTAITRTFENKNDSGIGSVAHVFTGVSAGGTINLEHQTSTSSDLTTKGANLIAIPLTTTTGNTLNYGLAQQSGTKQISSTSYVTTDVQTSLTLERSSNNGVYIAASFNTQASGSATGTWKLQYSTDNGSNWTDTGTPISRSMSSSSDTGSATMYGLVDGLNQGDIQVRLVCQSSDGAVSVETLNATVAAVALSYDNNGSDGYFEGFSSNTASLNKSSDALPFTGVSDTITLDNTAGGEEIFISMNFSAQGGQANQIADFDIVLFDEAGTTELTSNQMNERKFSSNTDVGSGGSVALFSGLSNGTYTMNGRYTSNQPLTSSTATMVGFSTEAIPEPAAVTFILWGGIAMLIGRRFVHR
ncbi:MAG: hypothetical protein JXR23_05085 [Pontiellaceae bacterium]|nr:hypothetical protein [Pontiellaceae bacterium]